MSKEIIDIAITLGYEVIPPTDDEFYRFKHTVGEKAIGFMLPKDNLEKFDKFHEVVRKKSLNL